MLPKKHRLTKREDFATVFSKGSFIGISEGVAIKILRNNLECTRLGFPVGKNYSKKATERNKARRILRSASLQYLKTLKPGFDIIVLIKADSFKDIDFKKTSLLLEKVFSKANLLT